MCTALLVAYALFIDKLSTLKIVYIPLLVIVSWYTTKYAFIFLKKGAYIIAKAVLICALAMSTIYLVIHAIDLSFFVKYGLKAEVYEGFFSPFARSPTMWWQGLPSFEYIVFFFLFVGAFFSWKNGRPRFFLFALIFFAMFFYYYLFFNRYYRPRYVSYMLPFFTILVGTGVAFLFSYTKIYRALWLKVIAIALIVFMLYPVFYYKNTTYAYGDQLTIKMYNRKIMERAEKKPKTKKKRSGHFNVTGEFHQNLRNAVDYLRDKVTDKDIIITTVFRPAFTLELGIEKSRHRYYHWQDKDKRQRVQNVMSKHDQGWIVLGKRRHGHMEKAIFPLKGEFRIADKKVECVFNKDQTQIFHWTKAEQIEVDQPPEEAAHE
jgi:hypothetical protein